jgi:hypothetical protein
LRLKEKGVDAESIKKSIGVGGRRWSFGVKVN